MQITGRAGKVSTSKYTWTVIAADTQLTNRTESSAKTTTMMMVISHHPQCYVYLINTTRHFMGLSLVALSAPTNLLKPPLFLQIVFLALHWNALSHGMPNTPS